MAADARQVAETYFGALARRDADAAAACWAPDGTDNLVGQAVAEGPAGVRAFFGELFAAIPDLAFEVETMVAEGDRVAVRWHAQGTFAGDSSFQGIAPTGGRVTLTGLDLLEVRDGLIVHNDAFSDGLGLARQIGMLPPQGSKADAACCARSTPRPARAAGSREPARSRSPTASGASAAACRGR